MRRQAPWRIRQRLPRWRCAAENTVPMLVCVMARRPARCIGTAWIEAGMPVFATPEQACAFPWCRIAAPCRRAQSPPRTVFVAPDRRRAPLRLSGAWMAGLDAGRGARCWVDMIPTRRSAVATADAAAASVSLGSYRGEVAPGASARGAGPGLALGPGRCAGRDVAARSQSSGARSGARDGACWCSASSPPTQMRDPRRRRRDIRPDHQLRTGAAKCGYRARRPADRPPLNRPARADHARALP